MNLPDISAPANSSGSSNFLKLKDGDAVKVVFIGEMYSFHQKWVGNKSVLTDKFDPDGKIRFRVNVACADPVSNELTVKIFEFPWSVFEKVKEINAEYPIETIKTKISRKGDKLETEYFLMPLVGPRDILSKAQLSAIQNLPLHTLDKHSSASAHKGSEEVPPPSAADEIPF